jgi:antitoxin ParD1/3/4
MNVNLTPQLEELIRRKVQSGLYNSASEVVREALRLLDEQDRIRTVRLEGLRREIQIGLAELDRSDVAPRGIEEAIRRARARQPKRHKGS